MSFQLAVTPGFATDAILKRTFYPSYLCFNYFTTRCRT